MEIARNPYLFPKVSTADKCSGTSANFGDALTRHFGRDVTWTAARNAQAKHLTDILTGVFADFQPDRKTIRGFLFGSSYLVQRSLRTTAEYVAKTYKEIWNSHDKKALDAELTAMEALPIEGRTALIQSILTKHEQTVVPFLLSRAPEQHPLYRHGERQSALATIHFSTYIPMNEKELRLHFLVQLSRRGSLTWMRAEEIMALSSDVRRLLEPLISTHQQLWEKIYPNGVYFLRELLFDVYQEFGNVLLHELPSSKTFEVTTEALYARAVQACSRKVMRALVLLYL